MAGSMDGLDTTAESMSHNDWPFFPDTLEPEVSEGPREERYTDPKHIDSKQSTVVNALPSATETKVDFEARGPFIPGYFLMKPVGTGSIAVVYRAMQLDLNRWVALKLFTRLDSSTNLQVQSEAEAVAQINHPNIMTIFGCGKYRQHPYLIFEYCDGGSLADFIKKSPVVPPAIAVAALLPLAAALDAAHQQGIIHRDIKPGNILLTGKRRDSVFQPYTNMPSHPLLQVQLKLGDFGLVRHPDHRDLNEGNIAGTPCYLAPEVASNGASSDPRIDIYSLGVVLYELLTGRPPFHEATVQKTLEAVKIKNVPLLSKSFPQIPRRLADICHQCLEKEPNNRYSTARQLADDLLRFLNDKPIIAQSHTRHTKAWWRRLLFQ